MIILKSAGITKLTGRLIDLDLAMKKRKEARQCFYLYRHKRVWQKVNKKSFWTELPGTVSNAMRFFVPEKHAG